MDMPTKISPCPIVEAVAEIRFEAAVPPETIAGPVYMAFKEKYATFETLPGAFIPPEIRVANNEFRFAPHYRMVADNYKIHLGPQVFSVLINGEYRGWSDYRERITSSFQVFLGLGIIKKIQRISLRYTDFFPLDIFEKVHLSILIQSDSLIGKETGLRTLMKWKDNLHILSVNNHSRHHNKNNESLGSVIDVDTICFEPEIKDASEFSFIYDQMHASGKNLFFSLLKSDFIQTLNPKYDE